MTQANVQSIDALRAFRVALIKFAETGNIAMSAAESDVDRTLNWLQRDQTTFWSNQVRKRQDIVVRCEEAVRQKRIFKNIDGTTPSAVDEQKALAKAKRAL